MTVQDVQDNEKVELASPMKVEDVEALTKNDITEQQVKDRPQLFGIDARYVVLPLLAVQNAGSVLLMRSTRSLPGEAEFSSQSAVIMQEIIKGLSCIALLLYQEGSIASAWNVPSEALKTVCEFCGME